MDKNIFKALASELAKNIKNEKDLNEFSSTLNNLVHSHGRSLAGGHSVSGRYVNRRCFENIPLTHASAAN